jgi:hypothetical protein
VIVTKNEILASLNAPETFILAIVQVESGFAQEPMYIRQFANREPGWSEAGVIFNLGSLLSIGSPPGWEEGKVATTAELLETVASTIADYREGEISRPDAAHVELWLAQFPIEDQAPVLSEMAHVLNSTYISREAAKGFINGVTSSEKIAGGEPKTFWKAANFLNIQKDGDSQGDLLELFNENFSSRLGLKTEQCGGGDQFVYLDDVIFTGMRAGNDLEPWIRDLAPKSATVHIIVIGYHEFGAWKMGERLKKAAADCGKSISVQTWSSVALENRMKYKNKSDVLWPVSLPEEAKQYTTGKFPFVSRAPGGASKIFSGESGRNALEQAFVRAGMRIRGFSENPSPALRPLGFSPFGVGFGSNNHHVS